MNAAEVRAKAVMTFSVMITTRNRCDDLRHTLSRLQSMDPQPLEILVCADGCTDGTVQMVTTGYPAVTLMINKAGSGSVPARDRMLRTARGEWVMSLDDDSYPLDVNFFSKVGHVVQRHPEVSVFTFPEQRDGGNYPSPTKTPQAPGHYVSAYPNCAALMNREDYMTTGGYPTFFVHAYEEPDYALQLCGRGKSVWFEPSLSVRHHLSDQNRSSLRTHHLHARNELWSVWMRCPALWLPLVALFRIARQFQHACTQGAGWVLREPLWWLDSLRGVSVCLKNRQPIGWPKYLAWMKRARHIQTGSSPPAC